MIKAFLVLMLSGFVGAVHAQEPIQALYNPRPPYLVPDSNGGVSGFGRVSHWLRPILQLAARPDFHASGVWPVCFLNQREK